LRREVGAREIVASVITLGESTTRSPVRIFDWRLRAERGIPGQRLPRPRQQV
jgi:hypothetical protein